MALPLSLPPSIIFLIPLMLCLGSVPLDCCANSSFLPLFPQQALIAMRQLHAEGAVMVELIDQFEAAEAWLGPMRP